MSYHFITTDMARWGSGQERPLTAIELDETIWSLKVAVESVVANGPPKIFAIRIVSNNTMWIDMTDGASFGPFPLPVASLVGRDEWAPNVVYNQNDLFSRGNKAYVVLHPHTSAATFSEGATDGSGNLVYSKLLTIESPLPGGGSQGMVLVKASNADGDVVWAFQVGLIPPGNVAGTVLSANSSTYADVSWKNSISLPTYDQVDISGDVVLDFADGECQRLNVVDAVTSLAIHNFGIAGRTSKLSLEIWGGNGLAFAWPVGWFWQEGVVPALKDKALFVLVTMDGGDTVYANPVGNDYRLAGT